jgi:chromosome segregation ATPase
MTSALKSSRIHTLLAVGICSLFVGGAAWGGEEVSHKTSPQKALPEEALPQKDLPQEASPEKAPAKDAPAKDAPSQEAAPEQARVLLDQVKKSEQDRAIAAKQTEIDRLKEDQTKAEIDAEALRKTMESTTGLINGAGEQLTNLTNDSRRLEHDLAVSQARIDAEQFKTAGLRALADAQSKALSAMTRRGEETVARSHVRSIELETLQAGQQPPRDGHEISHSDLEKARKALAVAEAKAESEERVAHDAMKDAGLKMALAEAKANYAQRLADNDLTLEPPKVVAKVKRKSPEKSAAKPAAIAVGPASAASPKAPISKGATKTNKTPTATPAPKAR